MRRVALLPYLRGYNEGLWRTSWGGSYGLQCWRMRLKRVLWRPCLPNAIFPISSARILIAFSTACSRRNEDGAASWPQKNTRGLSLKSSRRSGAGHLRTGRPKQASTRPRFFEKCWVLDRQGRLHVASWGGLLHRWGLFAWADRKGSPD